MTLREEVLKNAGLLIEMPLIRRREIEVDVYFRNSHAENDEICCVLKNDSVLYDDSDYDEISEDTYYRYAMTSKVDRVPIGKSLIGKLDIDEADIELFSDNDYENTVATFTGDKARKLYEKLLGPFHKKSEVKEK